MYLLRQTFLRSCHLFDHRRLAEQVVDSIFEGNVGTGMYASGGAQCKHSSSLWALRVFFWSLRTGCTDSIIGNVLEGNGGPGIIIFGASGVSVTSNYFE